MVPLERTDVAAAFGRAEARVERLTLARVAAGAWELRGSLAHPVGARPARVVMRCAIRRGDAVERSLVVAVTLTPEATVPFTHAFRLARPWEPGTLALDCRSERGEVAYQGRLPVR